MKKILLKKVIPILSVISIIISLFCFSVSAETNVNLYWQNLKPASLFAYFQDYNGNVSRVNDGSYNVKFDGSDYIYYIGISLSNESPNMGNNMFVNLNLADQGYKFLDGVEYSFEMKIIVPTVYTNDFGFNARNFSSGIYSWKSVTYEDRLQYNHAFSSPQIEDYLNNNKPLIWLNYPFKISGSTVDLSYIDVVGSFVADGNSTYASFGVNLPFNQIYGWHGWLGIGGLRVGMPNEYAPLPGGVPDYDTGNTDNMHNIENSINNQNQTNIDVSTNLFNNFGNLFSGNSRLLKGITGVTAIFGKLFNGLDWAQSLLTFSLTLGLVAFLLGSGVAIYNQGHNKRVRAERKKNKGGGG